MTTLAAVLPRLRARRIKPPKLPRWLWVSIFFTVIGFASVFLEVLDLLDKGTLTSGLMVANGLSLSAAWYRHTRRGFKAWKATQDSSAMPGEPVPDMPTAVGWVAALAFLIGAWVA
jgi:hypothetical protein